MRFSNKKRKLYIWTSESDREGKLKCLWRQTECTMPRSWLGKPQQSDSLFSPVVDQRMTADRLELTYLKLLLLTAALCFALTVKTM